MQKPHGSTPEPPEGVVVQKMPRAPAILPGVALARAPQRPLDGAGHPPMTAAGHPLAVHHQRVATAHEHFLRLEEEVHTDFLGHRKRLLEGLLQLWGQLPEGDARSVEPGGILSAASDEAPAIGSISETEAPADPEPVAVTTSTTQVSWGDWFLDAHVVPAGLLLAPLGKALAERGSPGSARAHGFGVLACAVTFEGPLPQVGATVATDFGVLDRPGAVDPRVADLAVRVDEQRVLHARASHQPQATAHAPRSAAGASAARDPGTLVWTSKRQFTERDLASLFEGDVLACFGKGFERAASHTRTPPLPGARLVRLSRVESLDPNGGPWSAGALQALVAPVVEELPPSADAGLRLARLYQGALQALAFFASAGGATIARDGWRFEPLQGQRVQLRFHDAPSTDTALTYDLIIERLEVGRGAIVVGDARAWAGDQLVLEAEGLGLALVPDWPLTSDRALQADAVADEANASRAALIEGFRLAYGPLLAGAVGRPGEAFREPGTFFETGERQMPRLPGPPYHFITRVAAVEGERLTMRAGASAVMEFDVLPDAWYFDENGDRTMPFCVLLEAALQPCGWLSVYVGAPLATTEDVFFRNLDGTKMVMTGEVRPDSGILRTHAKVTSLTRVSGVTLISYQIECFVGERRVAHLGAKFGYFPKEALDQQFGLPTTDQQRARLVEASSFLVDFAERPLRYFGGQPRLPGSILTMIDRITAFAPEGGAAGKGYLRAEKKVNPYDWYFRAHFYSDPVQPGSLGLEMMLQMLQFFAIEKGLAEHLDAPSFEPLALDTPVSWKFRGQVRPENGRIVTEMEIESIATGPDAVTIVGNGSLWLDGVRCYEAKGIAVRVRPGRPVAVLPPVVVESVLDPAVDQWVSDHRPSATVPVLPGMGTVDRLASAALDHVRIRYPPASGETEWHVVGVDDVRHHGWLVCDGPKRLQVELKLLHARAVHRVDAAEVGAILYELTDGAPPRRVSAGRVRLARRFDAPPRAWPPLADAVRRASPYDNGVIVWGPRLQLLRRWAEGAHGATAELDAAGAQAPIGAVHPILLDGTLHAIPHDELERWSDKVSAGLMGIPVRLSARFYGPPPRSGNMRAEIRMVGFDGASAFPTFAIQIIDPQGSVWATLRHVEILAPVGHRRLPREARVAFLVHRRFREGVGLSEFFPDRTELRAEDAKRLDALPGSVAHVYELERSSAPDLQLVAVKDHVGQRAHVHPGKVHVAPVVASENGGAPSPARALLMEGWCDELPLTRFLVSVEPGDEGVIVRDAAPPGLDVGKLREAWRRCGDLSQDVFDRAAKHLRRLSVAAPAELGAARTIFVAQGAGPADAGDLALVLTACCGWKVHPIAPGSAPASAIDEARALLGEQAAVVVPLGDEGERMQELRGPIADLVAASGAVLLPVVRRAHDSNEGGGVDYQVGRPIPPEDLRLLDHL